MVLEYALSRLCPNRSIILCRFPLRPTSFVGGDEYVRSNYGCNHTSTNATDLIRTLQLSAHLQENMRSNYMSTRYYVQSNPTINTIFISLIFTLLHFCLYIFKIFILISILSILVHLDSYNFKIFILVSILSIFLVLRTTKNQTKLIDFIKK